jgi:hypothetical protein
VRILKLQLEPLRTSLEVKVKVKVGAKASQDGGERAWKSLRT